MLAKRDGMEFFFKKEWNGVRSRQRAGPPAITNKSTKRRKQTTLFLSFNQLLWLKGRKSCVVCWLRKREEEKTIPSIPFINSNPSIINWKLIGLIGIALLIHSIPAPLAGGPSAPFISFHCGRNFISLISSIPLHFILSFHYIHFTHYALWLIGLLFVFSLRSIGGATAHNPPKNKTTNQPQPTNPLQAARVHQIKSISLFSLRKKKSWLIDFLPRGAPMPVNNQQTPISPLGRADWCVWLVCWMGGAIDFIIFFNQSTIDSINFINSINYFLDFQK